MNQHALDFTMIGILFVLLPLFAMWKMRQLQDSLQAGQPRARLDSYRVTMIIQWGLVVVALVLWRVTGREWSDLGLRLEGGMGAWIGSGLGLAVLVALAWQTRSVLRSAEKRREVQAACADLTDMLPQDVEESRAFTALSVTAGICEELLYRGFVLAVLTPMLGAWWAVAASSVAFGVAHAYQGPSGIAKTGAIGFAMAGLYLLTGSLWVPMIVHMAVDANSGYLAFRCRGEPTVVAAGTASCC